MSMPPLTKTVPMDARFSPMDGWIGLHALVAPEKHQHVSHAGRLVQIQLKLPVRNLQHNRPVLRCGILCQQKVPHGLAKQVPLEIRLAIRIHHLLKVPSYGLVIGDTLDFRLAQHLARQIGSF